MARKAKKSLRYPPSSDPTTWGAEFGLSYPKELEEGFERLRESLTHPQAEKGLTEIEFVIRGWEKDAEAMLRAEGYDPELSELLLWTDDHEIGVRLASAKAVLINAWRFRDSLESGDLNQAFINLMLLTAAAIRSDLFEPALRGFWAQISTDKGGEAAGQQRSTEADKRHWNMVRQARNLLSAGRPPHTISAIVADRHRLSARHVRSVLQKYGVLQKKGK
ncbi:MAG: hypothetical protein IIA72_04785 [Proteobacteria bacterium]|nr:hypothetical protein [Pseudomonadota bacterium]